MVIQENRGMKKIDSSKRHCIIIAFGVAEVWDGGIACIALYVVVASQEIQRATMSCTSNSRP